VRDDPGFRLQYRFFKDGKSIAELEARAQDRLEIPKKEPGVYAVVLEVFYPAYKGGNEQKGRFQAISPYLSYLVIAGTPPQTKLLEPVTSLVIFCGKDQGKGQDAKTSAGTSYKLLQGTVAEDWPKATKAHAWKDPKLVRFEITVPPETPGTLKLFFLDGDGSKRKQKITIQGRALPELEDFTGPGKMLDIHQTAQDTKPGKIEVSVENLLPTGNAVISQIEWRTLPR
jgi:hypothetical protein